MANTRKILKVFLASPGDLAEERQTAKFVVDEFNSLLADEFGYHVELVGWEDTVSVFGRPQATINKELERCELFIGILWKHWGTPPAVSGPYTSGFEEEFRTTVERRESTGKPEISLFLKTIAPEFLRDPGEQLKRVMAFRKELIEGKKILYENFEDARGFESAVRRLITSYVRRLTAEDQNEDQQTAPDPTPAPQDANKKRSFGGLPEESAVFLKRIITDQSDEKEQLTPIEIARLRLVALSTGSSMNDDLELGAHDANILHIDDGGVDFSYREQAQLLTSGLHNFQNENVPIWKPYAGMNGFTSNVLPVYTLGGLDTVRVGAFGAMREIGLSLESSDILDRGSYLTSWFSTDAHNSVRIAALGYLSEYGRAEDSTAIHGELSRNEGATSGASIEALVRIRLRDSLLKAVSTLIELQPTTLPESLVKEIYANGVGLPAELVEQSLGHSNTFVRYYALRSQRSTSNVSDDTLESLLADASHAVRAEALGQLAVRGKVFSLAQATLIAKPTERGAGLFASKESKLAENAWVEYRRERYIHLPIQDLEGQAFPIDFYEGDAFFALCERKFQKHKDTLRDLIKSKFAEPYDRLIQTIRDIKGLGSDTERGAAGVSDFVKGRQTRRALNLLGRRGAQSDLPLIRAMIEDDAIDYSATDAEFLRRFGEWDDIALLIKASSRRMTGHDGVVDWSGDNAKFGSATNAILALAKDRLEEVLKMKMQPELLAHLIAHCSDRVFRSFADELIIGFFKMEPDGVRKAAAIKCVKTLPKKRLTGLISTYAAPGQHRFYNVVRWLDLGISAPRNVATSAAGTAIGKCWPNR